ncbi:MAG: hypothetical protein ACR2FY_08850 [Pirellulaceae bacterium]
MCCDLLFVFLICKHVGEMVQEKGRNPLLYQVLMAVGWIGGEIVGGVAGAVLAAVVSNGNEDAIGIGAGVGVLLGIACGAGPAYLLAMNVTRDPNYVPPRPVPGVSPYGPSPYGPPPAQNPFANPAPSPTSSAGTTPSPSAAAPGIPSFLPSAAFAPANPVPRRVQFYCPSGHILEEWSTSAGEQRRCPHCGGVAMVPSG